MRRRLQTSPRPSVRYPGIEPGWPYWRRVYNPPRIHSGLVPREVALRDRLREVRQHHLAAVRDSAHAAGCTRAVSSYLLESNQNLLGFGQARTPSTQRQGNEALAGARALARSGAAAPSDRAGRLGGRPRHCLFCFQRLHIRLHMIDSWTHQWHADSDRVQGRRARAHLGPYAAAGATKGANLWPGPRARWRLWRPLITRLACGLENEKRPPGGFPGGL